MTSVYGTSVPTLTAGLVTVTKPRICTDVQQRLGQPQRGMMSCHLQENSGNYRTLCWTTRAKHRSPSTTGILYCADVKRKRVTWEQKHAVLWKIVEACIFPPLESFIMYEEWNMTISTPSFSLSNFASILPAPSCLPSPLPLLWHLVSHALYLSPIRAACIHGCGAIPMKHPLGSYQLPIALPLEGIPMGSSPTHSLTVAGLTTGLTSCSVM